jgi:hypothetical protein
LLGRQTRTRTEVGEVTFHGAGPDTHDLGGVLDGSTRGDEGCQYVHLALGRGPGKGAAQVAVPHASRRAAANQSSRPSIGMS